MAQDSCRLREKISPGHPSGNLAETLIESPVDVEEEAPMIGASGHSIGLRWSRARVHLSMRYLSLIHI